MIPMTEIRVVAPWKLRILVPHQLLEEFARLVNKKDLGEIITEALTEELKKIRFREDLNNVSRNVSRIVGQPVSPNHRGKFLDKLQQVC